MGVKKKAASRGRKRTQSRAAAAALASHPVIVDFLEPRAARRMFERRARPTPIAGAGYPAAHTADFAKWVVTAGSKPDPLIDETLSARRMNAEGRCWLYLEGLWVDGRTGSIRQRHSAATNEVSHYWLSVVLNRALHDRSYVVQLRSTVHGKRPQSFIRLVAIAESGDTGTNFFMDAPPVGSTSMVPGFVVVRGAGARLSWTGIEGLDWTVHDLRVQLL